MAWLWLTITTTTQLILTVYKSLGGRQDQVTVFKRKIVMPHSETLELFLLFFHCFYPYYQCPEPREKERVVCVHEHCLSQGSAWSHIFSDTPSSHPAQPLQSPIKLPAQSQLEFSSHQAQQACNIFSNGALASSSGEQLTAPAIACAVCLGVFSRGNNSKKGSPPV